MCQNIREIQNKYTGQKMFTSCGHCDACLQEKANKRAMRIVNNYADDGSSEMFFFMLSYDDRYIPYIRKSDICLALECNKIDSDHMKAFIDYSDENPYNNSVSVPIYRDYNVRWIRSSAERYYNTHKSLRSVINNKYYVCVNRPFSVNSRKTIDELTSTDIRNLSIDTLPSLASDDDKIAVAYYPDVQKFFKRLRINLQRDGFNIPLSYYACSEYGDKRSRAHFHVCLTAPKGYYTQIKRAVNKSWTFDFRKPKRSKFEYAIHPAGYIATYVNCGHNVPPLVQGSKQRPKSSYSQRFGIAKKQLSLLEVYKSFLLGDFKLYREKVSHNTISTTCDVIPKYVISRYAPKIKGYCRLDSDALFDIAKSPQRLFAYFRKCGFDSPKECRKQVIMLENKKKEWLHCGLSSVDFALFYSRCWSLRSSVTHKLSHYNINKPEQLHQYYYNIGAYYAGDFVHSALDKTMFNLPKNFAYEINPNNFKDVKKQHKFLLKKYHYRKHQRRVNSIAFNDSE